MTKTAITEKALSVLEAIAAGNDNREDVAAHLGTSVPTVNGSMTALKRHGLIEVDDDGNITLTDAASEFVTVKKSRRGAATAAISGGHREGTKMAEAAKIFEKKFAAGRPVVLEAFMKQVGLSKAGAATYYQTLRTQSGVAKKRPATKASASRSRRA
ncbi:MAG TPA: helix-turn-helix domain-containing protein [Candidatus Paceibacterota bacterium]